jgi:hypothetical protein
LRPASRTSNEHQERAARSFYPVGALSGYPPNTWASPQSRDARIDPNIYNQTGATFVTAGSSLAQEFRSAPTARDREVVRNLDGKPAYRVPSQNALSDMVNVLADGELRHLTKEDWDKLPDWDGDLP